MSELVVLCYAFVFIVSTAVAARRAVQVVPWG